MTKQPKTVSEESLKQTNDKWIFVCFLSTATAPKTTEDVMFGDFWKRVMKSKLDEFMVFQEISLEEIVSRSLTTQREQLIEWVVDKKQKCEHLRDSEHTSQSQDYFRGKVAILQDVLQLLSKEE